ncbi:hypothetical protein [Motiliproteus sp. MSK22-1]|uniref:hypothetical protein n=1 Tax=Motiliproteus sp. MSK22-1 TaxID=1897630 RepID=UPI00097710E1|nr:hypothetical protein [Motiliproteus sp. MSK22-1]OMH37990.1 hypothetical protein BGP75_06800 [Motiliproteus sp. MSK22-1]
MAVIVLKAIGVWLVIVITAIVNGLFREKFLVPALGAEFALPLSGVLLSVLVLCVSFALVSFLDSSEPGVLLATGLFWVTLTVCFEFLFGYYVVGKTWSEIMQVFNPLKGDLFVLAIFITALAPWLSAKARGIL